MSARPVSFATLKTYTTRRDTTWGKGWMGGRLLPNGAYSEVEKLHNGVRKG